MVMIIMITKFYYFLKFQLSRDEAIKFLSSVQAHLTKLRSRYQEYLIEEKSDSDRDDDAEDYSASTT